MESAKAPLKVSYGDTAIVERIEPFYDNGFDIWFSCFKIPIWFATKPDWYVGDKVKITFEKSND